MIDDPGLLVHTLATELNRAGDVLLTSRFGLSSARYRVLRALRVHGPVTQHALAEHVGVGDAVVSRMLPGLCAQGWCTVDDDPSHGRRKVVTLTAAGAEIEQSCSSMLADAFRGASEDAGVDVERLLTDVEAVTRQIRASLRS